MPVVTAPPRDPQDRAGWPAFAGPLEAVVREARDDQGAEIVAVTRLSGGASRETWGIEVRRGDGGPDHLILQRARPGAPGATEGSVGMGGEAALLEVVGRAGAPVAPVLAGDSDPDRLGAAFLLMERVEGETIARRILRDDEWAHARERFVGQAAEALAAIHSVPLAAAPALPDQDQVAAFRGLLDALGHPHPVFELAFRWLEDHRPDGRRHTVVHGDFRLGNLLLGPDGLRAVLDWELTHAGDPVEDLGWLCVRAWRFGSAEPVAGLGARSELLDAYAAASGVRVEPAELRWWEVMGTLKWGVMCIIQTVSHLAGLSRSVELAAIGRRVCETEYDLLLLLAEADGLDAPLALPEVPDRVPHEAALPHDRPGAAELVEAVREFLEHDVLPATSGRVQFHSRVAVNVLRTVERELSVGDRQVVAHRERLAALGVADDAELAAAIRSGALDDRLDEVTTLLRETVADKLAVANPRYAEG